ncbi:MAG: pectin acetylesterase-family hydrolase [bacterium]
MRLTRTQLGGLCLAALLCVAPLSTARAIGIEDVVDGGNTYAWQRVELPGAVCSNGSQYRFWYYDNPSSNNLLIMFEGGGACWDYASCSGQTGILGAANPNGIPTDYITQFKAKFVSPLINGADPGIPPFRSKTNLATNGFDMVYVPYCTGDVHVGNRVVTYTDPAHVNPPITFRHNGYNNSVAILNYLHTRFPSINKLVVTGFSAGGVASSAVFYQARRTLVPSKAYLLNDSGPIFPAPSATYNSRPLHELIKVQWNLASLYSQLPASFDQNNFGSMNAMVATQFPNDRMAYVGYSSDYNFSRFSYERFYPGITQAGVLQKWRADQTNLINQIKAYSNYSYHVPWHRPINDSHCVSIITFIGSHACPTVRKKYWYEIPIGQTWKCPSGNVPFDAFLTKFITNSAQSRVVEPENYYNNEDLGMQIVAPLINDAVDG